MPRGATPTRVFLLSPAHLGGKRAALLLRDEAAFPLAVRLREPGGVALGEAFSFLSGLYFRGKLAYAAPLRPAAGRRCGRAGDHREPWPRGRGYAGEPAELRAFGSVDIQPDDPRYRAPLMRDVARLAEHRGLELVLLGSVATGKYVDVLLDVVGERLLFPTDFVGRGDMSRGALLLRSAREGRELAYESVAGALARLRPRIRGAANDGGDQRRRGSGPDSRRPE